MTANILIVDDLETNIKVLEAKILKEYYIPYTAKSAKEAFEILKNHKIDVILLDCMMPEIDGFEACKIIKSSPDTMHIPVVIVTALTDTEDKIRGLEAGADEFLTKPVDDTALFARLKSLSSMKSAIDELKLRSETNSMLGAPVNKLIYDFSGSKVLLVNDDPIQSKNLIKRIKDVTSNVKVVTSQQEMHDTINKYFIPDIIIISCQMDDYDPLRLLASLKMNEFVKYASVMMLAEEDSMPIVLRALDLGATEYIIQPVESNELTARIKTQLQRKYFTDMLRSNIDTGMNLSIRDPLSGLFNRRYFDAHLPSLINKASTNNKSLYAMMIDIDNFKSINDEHGHQAGDDVIKSVAYYLLKKVPLTDLTARYGGEEFVAVLYNPKRKIDEIAEDLRKTIESSQKPISITISIGITELKETDDISKFICRADEALYDAKKSGRNLVRIA